MYKIRKTKRKEELFGNEAKNKEKEEFSEDEANINNWKAIRERIKENQIKTEPTRENKQKEKLSGDEAPVCKEKKKNKEKE